MMVGRCTHFICETCGMAYVTCDEASSCEGDHLVSDLADKFRARISEIMAGTKKRKAKLKGAS
jgi:hypothetical protein